MDSGLFPNGIAVSPDDCVSPSAFSGGPHVVPIVTGPTMGCPQCARIRYI